MLEYLVAEDNLTCEERDRVILRIARENDIAEYMLSNLAGYGRSKQEVLKRAERRKSSELQGKKQDESYISLTEIARAHSEDAPGYVIQSWLRNGNTLAFLISGNRRTIRIIVRSVMQNFRRERRMPHLR